MKTVMRGDLVKLAKQGQFDVIVHGCNCFCVFGAGIALQLKYEFPVAYEKDLETIEGDQSKLGKYTKVTVMVPLGLTGHKLTIVNAYTQYTYGRNRQHTDYNAIRDVFRRINEDFPKDVRIGIPMIGAGLGGGFWPDIDRIISEELKDRDYTVVEFG